MSDMFKPALHELVSSAAIDEINGWIAKFPVDKKQSAVLSALQIVQDEKNFLSKELMIAVADYLGMAPIAVFEVANFYSMYELKPVGRHVIGVCASISCQLRGCNSIINHLEDSLGIKCGETTPDQAFTLRTVECLGACSFAPMMQVGKTYHENLSPEVVDKILADYREA